MHMLGESSCIIGILEYYDIFNNAATAHYNHTSMLLTAMRFQNRGGVLFVFLTLEYRFSVI